MQYSDIKVIGRTFQKINDMVVPTMGAKGRLAIIQTEMDRPTLTDDGVTVAREMRGLKDFEQMVAVSMIEAAGNTEREAYDGTTLTVMMVNELYKQGLSWIKWRGMHPQQAADKLMREVREVREELKAGTIKLEGEMVRQLATITTKIPLVGDIVYQAWQKAGDDMNVVIEHDREGESTRIDWSKGLVLESGYFSDVMKCRCNENGTTVYQNARVALLSEKILTAQMLKVFFNSIPEENLRDPFVFIIDKGFNPEALKMLTDVLIENEFKFQFVFLNEDSVDDLYMDIAAMTNGKIQDPALGTSEYRWEYCGLAEKIVIEQNKTIINGSGDVTERVGSYKERLDKGKYQLGVNGEARLIRRLSSLQAGLVKIKVVTATVTEYMTLRMKLDDAIGAVRKALKHGVVLGGGKALSLISNNVPALKKTLLKPAKQIARNAGLTARRKLLCKGTLGLDVRSGEIVDLLDAGIIDSFYSIDQALKNAVSIASGYLRAYTLIKK